MSLLGMYNMTTNVVEGSDDPGRIFIKKQNVRALISALSLPQLQGCDGDFNDPENSWMLVFTVLLGLIMLLPMVFSVASWMSFQTSESDVAGSQDPDHHEGDAVRPASCTEPAPEPVPLWAGVNTAAVPSFGTSSDAPEPFSQWSPEALIVFMYDRCQRRHDDAQTGERRMLYDSICRDCHCFVS